ncbi:MAG: hypothetical protein QW051_04095 [Candidatus Aenigmatarchaeota archaeon]
MKKFFKYLILYYLVGILPLSLISKNNVFQKIQNTVEYKGNDLIFAIFLNLGDCQKCIQIPLSLYECSLRNIDKTNDSLKFKKLAIVKSNREVELKRFRKIYNWDGYCFFNDGSVQKELGLPNNVWFSIFYLDTCLYYNTYESSYEQTLNCDSLTNLLREIILQIERRK